MPTMISTLASSGGVRQIATGVVRTLTDTGPTYSFAYLSSGRYYYDFTQKQERWYADIAVPEMVDTDKVFIFLQGSAKCDDLTYFRRPVCGRVIGSDTIRIYADDTGADRRLNQLTAVTDVPSAIALSLTNPGGPSSIVSSQLNGHDIRWTLVEYV